MPKRRLPKPVPTADMADSLRSRLTKCTKGELVDILVELATSDRSVLRHLDARLEFAASPEELAIATRHAIADATRFDERDINRNFYYDYAAYDQVKRNLTRLVQSGELRLALVLSIELMEEGSRQAEASDEGLMIPAIEGCLLAVLAALPQCDLPREEKLVWCSEMLQRDRLGTISERQLIALRSQFASLPQ